MPDITPEQGRKITAEAMTWKDTPYSLVGDKSIKGQGGDCSGSTFLIYAKCELPYPYQDTSKFASYADTSGRFRKLDGKEARQDGDILLWDEHMAIYSTFKAALEAPLRTTARVNKAGKPWTQINDMWTAHHTDGPPYGTAASKYFEDGDIPDTYRYVLLPST